MACYFRDRTTVARGNTGGSGQLTYRVDRVTKADEGSYSCMVRYIAKLQ